MRRLAAPLSLTLLAGLLLMSAPSPATAAETATNTVQLRDKKPKPAKAHAKKPHKKPGKHTGKKPHAKPHRKPAHKASKPSWKQPTSKAPRAKAPKAIGGKVCPVRSFDYGDGFGADRGKREHLGLDMSGRRGAPLFAIESGRIDRTKVQSNHAVQIVMKGRSGSKYYYGHMDKVYVHGGQRVKAGQVIGSMGDTGSPGEVHLHFEYWKSGGESAAIDPEPLIHRICRG